MKPYIVILLLFSVLLQGFSKVFILADYQLNKAYISEILCENKAQPELDCEGKCHLKKQLENDTEKEQSPLNQKQNKTADFVLICQFSTFSFSEITSIQQPHPLYQAAKPVSAIHSIFHPPQARS